MTTAELEHEATCGALSNVPTLVDPPEFTDGPVAGAQHFSSSYYYGGANTSKIDKSKNKNENENENKNNDGDDGNGAAEAPALRRRVTNREAQAPEAGEGTKEQQEQEQEQRYPPVKPPEGSPPQRGDPRQRDISVYFRGSVMHGVMCKHHGTWPRREAYFAVNRLPGGYFQPTESPHLSALWENPKGPLPEPCKRFCKGSCAGFDTRSKTVAPTSILNPACNSGPS